MRKRITAWPSLLPSFGILSSHAMINTVVEVDDTSAPVAAGGGGARLNGRYQPAASFVFTVANGCQGAVESFIS